MNWEILPGLREPGEEVDTTSFVRRRTPVTVHAKWWMRPICWVLRKPTTRTVWR